MNNNRKRTALCLLGATLCVFMALVISLIWALPSDAATIEELKKQMAEALGKDEHLAAEIVEDVARELDGFIERLAAKTEIRLI